MGRWRVRNPATSVPFLADLDRPIWSGRANGHRRSRARVKSLRPLAADDGLRSATAARSVQVSDGRYDPSLDGASTAPSRRSLGQRSLMACALHADRGCWVSRSKEGVMKTTDEQANAWLFRVVIFFIAAAF